MGKFFDLCYKALLYILFILFFIIAFASLFFDIFEGISWLSVLLGVVILFFAFNFFKNKIKTLSEKQIKISAVILCILFFVGMLLIGIFMPSKPVTDLSHIHSYAKAMVMDNNLVIEGSYFSKYTNQIPLVMLVYFFYRVANIFGSTSFVLFGTLFNTLFMSVTAYFVFLVGKEIKNSKAGFISLIFMVLNPIFYLYSSYYYTDTLCMPFAVIGLFLLIKSLKEEKLLKKILFSLFSGTIFFIGFKIRVVVMILLIAGVCFIILSKNIKVKVKILCSLLLGLFIGFLCYKVIYSAFDIKLDKEKSFPVTHWVMMGLNLNEAGGYNASDHDKTLNEKTYEEKKDMNIKVIKERINKLELTGIIKLDVVKLVRTWSSGSYGVFAKFTNTQEGGLLYNYLGGSGKNNIYIKYILQVLKSFINFIILIGIYEKIKSKNKGYEFDTILYIAIFGAVIFYLIWEASQRYSLTFLPWITILFGLILYSDSKTSKKIIKDSYGKYFKGFMMIAVLLIVVSFLGKQRDYTEEIRILSYRGFDYASLNNIIKQTFSTSKSFNKVELQMLKQSKEKGEYLFELNDETSGIVLYKEKFNSLENSGKYVFDFKTIFPKKENEYSVNVKKITKYGDLKINFYENSKYYKVYDKGNLYIGDKKTNGTLVFKVSKS